MNRAHRFSKIILDSPDRQNMMIYFLSSLPGLLAMWDVHVLCYRGEGIS